MGVTVISLCFPRAPEPPLASRLGALLAILAQRRLRICCIPSAAFLQALESTRDFAALDAIASQETGLWVPYTPELLASGRTGGSWWERQTAAGSAVLIRDLAVVRRLTGHHPAVLAVEPAAYSPPLAAGAARLGIPLLAHAPFDNGGSLLSFAGSCHATCHLDLTGLIAGTCTPAAWHQRLAQLRREREEAPLIVGGDLTPAPPNGRRSRKAAPDAVLDTLPDTLAALGQLTGYRELLPAPATPLHLNAATIVDLARQVRTTLRPLQTGDRICSQAELLAVFAQAGQGLLETGALPDRIYPLPPLGPLSPTPVLAEVLLRRQELLGACGPLLTEISGTGHLPPVVEAGGRLVAPGAFLVALANALCHPASPMIRIPAGPLPQLYATRPNVRRAVDELAAVHPPAHGRRLRNAILAQCWTARPAG